MDADIRLCATGRDAGILRLLMRFLQLESRCSLDQKTSGRAVLKTGDLQIEGLSAVSRHLALINNRIPGPELLGTSPEESAVISQWLSEFLSPVPISGDSKPLKLNDHLEQRLYLVGQRLTLADVLIYGILHPEAVAFPVAQYGRFCNLLRWHQFIQDSVDVASVFPPAKRQLPVFDFTIPTKTTDAEKQEKKAQKEAAKSREKAECKTEEEAGPPVADANGDLQRGQKISGAEKTKKKKKEDVKEKKPAEAKRKAEPRIDMVDLRIGKIMAIKRHPDAESLYIEEIDVGEEKPRQIISGLVKFVSIEEMEGRMVVVCCNLKPANMRGVQSCGMVMCASNADHTAVEPLIPPADASIGEKVVFDGYDESPLEEIKPKQKILEALFPDLVTDAGGIAKYKDTVFMTSKGPISSSIFSGNIR